MTRRMQSLRMALAAALVLALVPFAGVQSARADTATSTDSSSLTKQVRHNLATLPWYGVFDNLAFQVNGTEVTLLGQLTSEHAVTKDDAENAVRHIPGVTRIINQIEILPPSMFDDQIRRAEYRTIFSQGDLGRYTMGALPQVRIVVKNGHVTLEGVVMNQMDKTMAGIFANSVSGVFSVTNNLQID